MSQCVWWCPKQTNLYNPAHRCAHTEDLVEIIVKGKKVKVCRHHRIAFQKTGKLAVKP